MANELICYSGPKFTGLTVVARIFLAGVQVGTDINTTEVGATGVYRGDMPAVAAGKYVVCFFDADDNQLCSGEICWNGTAEVEPVAYTPIEGTLNLDAVLRILLARAAGKASGGGTTKIKFRDQADSKDRIEMTVDASGSRSVVIVDGS